MSILGFMPRIVIASFVVHLIVQWADYLLYGFLKRTLHDRYLVARNVVSIMLTQLLDTVLFSFLGLYGIIENIWQVIVVSYVSNWLPLLIASPFVLLSKKIHSS